MVTVQRVYHTLPAQSIPSSAFIGHPPTTAVTAYISITKNENSYAIKKRVYPHLLRHSIATILLDSGLVPIDQVQKFLGHLHLSTTQIYAETSLRALGDNYIRALGGKQ